jgi:23S rRNA (uracil1939-C5)-methyltransferase
VQTARVDALGSQGDGVALAGQDGARRSEPLFIAGAVPGDLAAVRPVQRKGAGWLAEIVEIVEPGPDRVVPPCPHFDACGGCQVQQLAAPTYRAWKRGLVVEALGRAGLDVPVEGLVTVPQDSRRRLTLHARRLAAGVVLGFHGRRSDRIVDLRTCLIAEPALVALLPALRALLGDCLAPGQSVDIALAALADGVDLCLIGGPSPDLAVRERMAGFAQEHDLARLSWRAEANAPADPIAHRRHGLVRPGGVPVSPPPGAFMQASAAGQAALIDLVLDGVGPAASIADLFCGIGTFTLPLLAAGKAVQAVDSDPEGLAALDAAARAALLAQKLTHARRNLLKAPLSAEELDGMDAVVLDPPRGGAKAQAEVIASSRVPVVAGVSCNPVSFARDARVLVEAGYRLTRVVPVDQFVWSAHVELVGQFMRD